LNAHDFHAVVRDLRPNVAGLAKSAKWDRALPRKAWRELETMKNMLKNIEQIKILANSSRLHFDIKLAKGPTK
jgi:hypothetical protein